jgi:hypothetical protein
MTEVSIQTRRKKRFPRWAIVILILGALWLALAAPMLRYDWRFRESAMRGLTPDQVIARCGEPTFAWHSNAMEEKVAGEPVWQRLTPAARQRLLALDEFLFGYYGAFGDHYSVYFKNERVDHIAKGSR